ncbi:MAG: aminopeptidase, partial [Clostridiales bacterium]|nr:aminopeptidase [Candidatus Coliplasma caballi]
MKKTLQHKYAKLLVKTGVNIQKGQTLVVRADTEVYPFVEILADEAYKAGAGNVVIEWSNQALTRLEYRHRSVTALSTIEDWEKSKLDHDANTNPATIRHYAA